MKITQDHITLIYVPCGSEQEAVKLSKELLEHRLIACANIHASRSIYAWKGEMVDEQEFVLLCKTSAARSDAAARRVRELHSYDIPCIITMQPVQVNHDFARWVNDQLRAGSSIAPAAEARLAD